MKITNIIRYMIFDFGVFIGNYQRELLITGCFILMVANTIMIMKIIKYNKDLEVSDEM